MVINSTLLNATTARISAPTSSRKITGAFRAFKKIYLDTIYEVIDYLRSQDSAEPSDR